ncbi:hypothetical protein AB0G35_13645 [Streptomyces sp. NPDC021749]|uniref:hypothetical protein n=1 Tax=Streptomyces sp. NPDC021749 TaxID=3154905 RepID=UPI0033C4DB68
MRVHQAARALLVSAAAVSILGTTPMASGTALAADHGATVQKKSCKVSAYTDRLDRKTDKFGSGAVKCHYKPAYTKFKDGLRVEVRGTVNSNGQPGYRCYGNYKGGWQVCHFDRQMAEKHVFLWYVSTRKGDKIKWTSDEKMLRTS